MKLHPQTASLHAFRRSVLRRHGATAQQSDELLDYNRNAFSLTETPPVRIPRPDEAFAAAWTTYADEARTLGVLPALQKRLVQLRFPVRPGIHETDSYHRATRLLDATHVEALPLVNGGVNLEAADALDLRIHRTPAGRIPVILAGSRADFVTLYGALLKKNEPTDVPDSLGAVMVSGYTNWDRIHRIRQDVEQRNSKEHVPPWPSAFQTEVQSKQSYNDRFILASPTPYSAVTASDLEFTQSEWLDRSIQIRIEHEAAHYVTRRLFGSMRNVLHDELIADYAGISAAWGTFRADWFLRFMGLEAPPALRASGRLNTYRGTPRLSDGAFSVLQSLTTAAAQAVERVDTNPPNSLADLPDASHRRFLMLVALAQLTVEELASSDADDRLEDALCQTNRWFEPVDLY